MATVSRFYKGTLLLYSFIVRIVLNMQKETGRVLLTHPGCFCNTIFIGLSC